MKSCLPLLKLRRSGPSIESDQWTDHSFFPPSEGGKNESRSHGSKFYRRATPTEFRNQRTSRVAQINFTSLHLLLLLLLPLAFSPSSHAQSARADSTTNATLWLIPHTHWEG